MTKNLGATGSQCRRAVSAVSVYATNLVARKHAKIGRYSRDYLPDEKLSYPQIWGGGYPPPPVYILYLYCCSKEGQNQGKLRAFGGHIAPQCARRFMKLFRVFDVAESVLDANVMLDLRRLPPERGQALLAILEELIDQVWMPLQFYAECRENLASAHGRSDLILIDNHTSTIGLDCDPDHFARLCNSKGCIDFIQ